MSSTTANMSLTKWAATDRFDYTQLANNWDNIAAHDHSNGKGVQITASGIATRTITGGSGGNIAPNTITSGELAIHVLPGYRKGYKLPVSQTANAGTVSLSSDGIVTGSSTNFDSSMVGGIITINGNYYTIIDWTNTTQITVSNPSSSSVASGSAYTINYTLNNDDQVLTDAASDSSVSISIASATVASNIATYTTSSSHNLASGQLVTISGVTGDTGYNGTNLGGVSGITVTGATTFTIPATTASGYSSIPTTSATSSTGAITNVKTNGTWAFRYSAADLQWNFVGGTPISKRDSTGTATNLTGTYTPIGSITFPYKGVYNLSVSGKVSAGTTATVAPAITATATATYLGTASVTGYATYTLGSTAHGLVAGQTVTISGISAATNASGWNGTFVIVAADTYRFTVASSVAAMTTPGYTSSSITYTPINMVYIQAATSSPADDNLAAQHTGSVDLCQNRTVTITTAGTTYNLYVKASGTTGTPTVKNWSISAIPVVALSGS